MSRTGSSQKKNVVTVDSDDDDTLSSASTSRSDLMSVSGADEVEIEKDTLLDQALEALFEKRGATREKALSAMIEAFNGNLQHEFVEKKFVTLLHQSVNSIKRGSSKEVSLASHLIGLLAITIGCGENAHYILEESAPVILQALKSPSDSSKVASLLDCLAIITFIGGNEHEETERSMQIMWQVARPKVGPNVVAAKASAAVIAAVVSAWTFLLTTVDVRSCSSKDWQGSISYFSTLLEKEDRSIRIAAGEALALIFDIGSLEKFSLESEGSDSTSKGALMHIQGLKAKILNQVRNLAVEAGGKGSAKKDLNNQRNTFKDILEFLEDGYAPETTIKIGGDSLSTSTWTQLIQLNFMKRFLGGGFVKHMQENEFLQEVFGFTPKKKPVGGSEFRSSKEKRLFKSPNSVLNKARTQHLNKQRQLAQGKNTGRFVVRSGDKHEEEA